MRFNKKKSSFICGILVLSLLTGCGIIYDEEAEESISSEESTSQSQQIDNTDSKDTESKKKEQSAPVEPKQSLEECMMDGIYGVVAHTTIEGDQRSIDAYGGEYDGEIYLYYKYNDRLFLKTSEQYAYIMEVYSYDSNGDVAVYYDSEKNCSVYQNGKIIETVGPNITEMYTYDTKGNLAEITTYDSVSNSHIMYTYKNGLCVYDKRIENGQLQYENNYIYDDNGYLIEQDEHTLHYNRSGTKVDSEYNHQIFYHNDDKGNPIEVEGGNRHDFYTYYDNGQVKTKKDCLGRMDPPEVEIEYDINGNRTLYRDNHQDSSVNYSKIDVRDTVYKYDEKNRVISTEEYENGELEAGYYVEYREIPQDLINQLVPELIKSLKTDYPKINLDVFTTEFPSSGNTAESTSADNKEETNETDSARPLISFGDKVKGRVKECVTTESDCGYAFFFESPVDLNVPDEQSNYSIVENVTEIPIETMDGEFLNYLGADINTALYSMINADGKLVTSFGTIEAAYN